MTRALATTGLVLLALSSSLASYARAADPAPVSRRTVVGIDGQSFLINGKPTYAGRTYRGMKVEGLLMNARLVQGIFDDQNPQTCKNWDYPDGPWDPDRNTREFIA